MSMSKLGANLTARKIHNARIDMDTLICGTPTGEVRNKLTEANIHLWEAQKALDEAIELDRVEQLKNDTLKSTPP